MKKKRDSNWLPLLTLIIAASDQITKYLVVKNSNQLPWDIIKNIFSITYVQNKGAAFGMLQDKTYFFIAVSIIAIIALVWMQFSLSAKTEGGKQSSNLLKISLYIILGGTIGNLIDRFRFGYVIDFLDFKIWPVFNVADSAISVGAALLAIYLIKGKK